MGMNARRLTLILVLSLTGCMGGNGLRQTVSTPAHKMSVQSAPGASNAGKAAEHVYQSEQQAKAPRADILALKRAGKARRSTLPPGWRGEPPPVRISTDSSTQGKFEAQRLWSNYVDWEPAIAVDRSSPYVYQLTNRFGVPQCEPGCADPAIIFRRSSDGGNTWEPDQYILQTKGAQYDPEIEVAEDGVLYAAMMANYAPGVVFMKSRDRGKTWSDPIPMAGRGTGIPWSDKPMLAVSWDGRDVYLAFNASNAFVASSHDYGETWETPIMTNNDARSWFHSGAAVALNGDVYFASSDYAADFRGEVGVSIIRSTDGGKSWVTDRVDTSAEVPDCSWAQGCYFGFFGPQADVAVDSDGTVMIAYNVTDVDGAPQSLYVKTSINGVGWSERTLISPPSATVLAGFPALTSGLEPGDFRLAWIDDRNASKAAFNVWYRETSDGGLTWSEAVRLSAAIDGAPYKTADGFAFPYGDYLEIGVDGNGATHVIWGEGTSYDDAGGTWYTRAQSPWIIPPLNPAVQSCSSCTSNQ